MTASARPTTQLTGTWRLLESEAPVVAWAWDDDIVRVNLSDQPAGGLGPWGFQLG